MIEESGPAAHLGAAAGDPRRRGAAVSALTILRVGVIGLGMISRAHLAAYAAAEDAESRRRVRSGRRQGRGRGDAPGARGSTDYRSLLADPDVDAVDLLLPHALHFPIAKEALEAGQARVPREAADGS